MGLSTTPHDTETPEPEGRKVPFEIAAKLLEIDLRCQLGCNRYLPMNGLSNEPIPDLCVPQIEGSQIGDHRLMFVEFHCGYDLVLFNIRSNTL